MGQIEYIFSKIPLTMSQLVPIKSLLVKIIEVHSILRNQNRSIFEIVEKNAKNVDLYIFTQRTLDN